MTASRHGASGGRGGKFASSWDEVATARKLLDGVLKAAAAYDKNPGDTPPPVSSSALLKAVRAVLELDPDVVRPARWPPKRDPRLEGRWVPELVEGRTHFADQMAFVLAAVLVPRPVDRPDEGSEPP